MHAFYTLETDATARLKLFSDARLLWWRRTVSHWVYFPHQWMLHADRVV